MVLGDIAQSETVAFSSGDFVRTPVRSTCHVGSSDQRTPAILRGNFHSPPRCYKRYLDRVPAEAAAKYLKTDLGFGKLHGTNHSSISDLFSCA